VLGFDQAVVAGGPFRLLGRPLQAWLPQLVEFPTHLLEVRRGLQREGEGCGRERDENPLTDEGIDGLPGEILVIVPPIVGADFPHTFVIFSSFLGSGGGPVKSPPNPSE